MPTCAAGSRRRGFTLLELVVTLAIAGLLAALAAPAVASRLLEEPASRTARLVRGLVLEGREAAATTGRPHAVVWSPEFGRFALVPADSSPARRRSARSLPVPANVRVESHDLVPVQGGAWGGAGAVGLLLLPLGGSTGGAVTLSSPDRSVTVRVDPLTGYARYAARATGPRGGAATP